MANRRDFTKKNPKFTGTSGAVVPGGTQAERDASPIEGSVRYNTDLGLAEFYTSTGWAAVAPPPSVSSISGFINESTDTTITVLGSGFDAGATVTITGAAVGGIDRQLVTTFVNSGELTAATNASSVGYVAGASFDVNVTNTTGLSSTLTPAGIIDSTLTWNTSSGSLGTFNDTTNVSTAVSATDPDGTPVTYSITSGSLPAGLSLNTSTGAITGDPNNVSNNTTSNFTVTATSNSISLARSFSITISPTLDGSTSARAATSPQGLRNVGISTNGSYWIYAPNNGQTQARLLEVEFNAADGKDWVKVMQHNNRSTPTINELGYSIPWKGYMIQGPSTGKIYSYFSSYQAYNSRGSGSTTSGGNKGGYRVFFGAAGGQGFYNTGQNPCSWGDSSGAVGAGWDGGTCGSWPNNLIMGTGNGGTPVYSEQNGTWYHWIWMDNAT